jgi:hypothetical protein
MPATHSDQGPFSEAAIFARAWETAEGGLTPELAKHLVRVGFSNRDKGRMRELAVKNREGKLTADERAQLGGFIKVGDFLAILQSKARKALAAGRSKRNGNA